jgi:hypothetical protein
LTHRTTHLLRAGLLAAAATTLLLAPATFALDSGPSLEPSNMTTGKRLYRKYCGQCHSLTVALAAGFGSNNGLGTDGGPSFETLRVPFNLSVLAVTQPFIGHERLVHKMTWIEIKQVSAFVATATKHHTVLAHNIDG